MTERSKLMWFRFYLILSMPIVLPLVALHKAYEELKDAGHSWRYAMRTECFSLKMMWKEGTKYAMRRDEW